MKNSDKGHMRLFHNIRLLFVINQSTRPWHMPFVCSICVGIPVLTGAFFGYAQYGILAGMGSMVFLYIPQANIAARMSRLSWCLLGFLLCFALGASASFNPYLAAFMLFLVCLVGNAITRFYRVLPPANFFFILVTSIAGAIPYHPALLPMQIAAVGLGGILAICITYIYSLIVQPVPQPLVARLSLKGLHMPIMVEGLMFGTFVGGSFLLAKLLNFHNPYWVPISCAAIMQGATFQAVWMRKVHRIMGTVVGMGLTWLIFKLSPTAIQVGLLIMLLNFLIEYLVVRNYAVAVIFIMPLTVLFAESSAIGISPNALVVTRLIDIVIGSSIGLVGGWMLHRAKFLSVLRAP